MLILKLIGLTVIILALAFLGLGLKIFFTKNGKFPEHRVGHNKEMRKRKIYCVKTQDKIELNLLKKERRLQREQEKMLLSNNRDTSPKDFENLSLNIQN